MENLFAVATEIVNPYDEDDKFVCDFMGSCKGFKALYNTPTVTYSLWMYDTKEHAISARNLAGSQGIYCRYHVTPYTWDGEDEFEPVWNTDELDLEAAKKRFEERMKKEYNDNV